MGTVDAHLHKHDDGDWPFDAPANTAVFATSQVAGNESPVLLVFHDGDGEWQFLHGEVGDSDKPVIVCLGCILQRDRTLAALADLLVGWCARRAAVGAPWQRDPYVARDDV